MQWVPTSLSVWQSIVDATGTNTRITYSDPTRSIGSYNGSIGGVPTVAAFLAAARQQSNQNWNSSYAAASVLDYIRAGFVVVP
jgi:hypothetical protein